MTWQALYRRYRSRRFADVVGQAHVVAALRNAVRDGRVGHAYLFSGPRGTGKTSCARILAKALNCENPQDGEPCLECESCLSIEAGTSYDVHELDAASNNGVEAMRDLIAKAALGTPGRTKVYILDEVHMLSAAAEAALLKTLEEPPAHVVFVLATTDPQKVNETIRSRTQWHQFSLLPADALERHVRWIVADAGLDLGPDPDAVIAHVLRVGGGSARDTLSALDQVVAAGGIDDRATEIDDLLDGLLARDPGAVLAAVHTATIAGRDVRVLGQGLVGRLRDTFLHTLRVPLDHLPDGDRARVAELAERAERPFLTRALEVIGEALVAMREAADPRITLETALVRLADPTADTSVAALLERIERLERALAGGSAPVRAPAQETAPETRAAPAPRARPSPAEEARRKLRERSAAAGAAPAPPAVPAPPAAPASPATSTGPATPPPAGTGAPAAAAGPLPALEELEAAWSDRVLPSLPGQARARYAGGSFVEVAEDAAVFGLPNDIHRSRCEEQRPTVEAALAAAFGRPVPLRLVVAPARRSDDAPSVPDPDHEVVDLDELRDATDAPPRSAAERLAEAFPGSELLEDQQ